MVLDNLAILVVEDEPVIAMALTFAIRNAGGVVIGPAASVRGHYHCLKRIPSGPPFSISILLTALSRRYLNA